MLALHLKTQNAFLYPREPFVRFKSGFCVVLGKARYGRTGKAGSIANGRYIVGLRRFGNRRAGGAVRRRRKSAAMCVRTAYGITSSLLSSDRAVHAMSRLVHAW